MSTPHHPLRPPTDIDIQAIHDRLIRIETRLVKLMLHFGVNSDGNVTQKIQPREEVNMLNKLSHSPTHWSTK